MTNLTLGDMKKISMFLERYYSDDCDIKIDQKNDVVIFTQELPDGSYETAKDIFSDLIKRARDEYLNIFIIRDRLSGEQFYALRCVDIGEDIIFDSYKIANGSIVLYRRGEEVLIINRTDEIIEKLKIVKEELEKKKDKETLGDLTFPDGIIM